MRTLIGLPSMTLLSRIRCSLDGSGGDRRRVCDCRRRSEALKGAMEWGRGAKVCIKGPSDGRGRDERMADNGVKRGHVLRGTAWRCGVVKGALHGVVGLATASALILGG